MDPGQIQTINVTGLLFTQNSYHVAIRAVDEGGREGPWVSVPVDLTMPTATFNISPAAGWGGDDFFNAGSVVEAIAANLPGAAWQRCRTHYPELVIMSRLFVFVLVIVMLQMERSA